MRHFRWLLCHNDDLPIDIALRRHITRYEMRYGVTPNQALVHMSALAEATAHGQDLTVHGTLSMQPGEMLLRYQEDETWM